MKKTKFNENLWKTNAIYDGNNLFHNSIAERIRRGEFLEVTE